MKNILAIQRLQCINFNTPKIKNTVLEYNLVIIIFGIAPLLDRIFREVTRAKYFTTVRKHYFQLKEELLEDMQTYDT